MDLRCYASGFLAASLVMPPAHALAEGDAANGEKLFNGGTYRCYTCHSLEPGEHKLGPSLADLFGRQAGSVQGYTKYSEAITQSGVVWNEESLDRFLANPQAFIPGNNMLQAGYYQSGRIPSASLRADVIAYLKQATEQ